MTSALSFFLTIPMAPRRLKPDDEFILVYVMLPFLGAVFVLVLSALFK
jgi:hypothetical protein